MSTLTRYNDFNSFKKNDTSKTKNFANNSLQSKEVKEFLNMLSKMKTKRDKKKTKVEYIHIDVIRQDNHLTFKLLSHNHLSKKRTITILESMSLPEEYNYGDYKPIITTGGR